MTSITVIGTGYLGATHAACMAELGYDVLGIDRDAQKISELSQGCAPFYEPGLNELIAKHTASGRLRFSTSFAEAADFADVHFLCVGTPQLPGSDAADLRHVDSVIDELVPLIDGQALLIGKSTVPVGTCARLGARIAQLTATSNARVELAWNPEFLREGSAVKDTLTPDRLVVGVGSIAAEDTLRDLYRPLINSGIPFLSMDFATAELVKVAANSFLATKISFINAMAEVCEAAGADVTQLSQALSHDPRIGGRFLSPGLGFGGGCLPKDIRGFVARATELGVGHSVTFLKEVDAINLRRRTRTVELARELCGGTFEGKRIAIWGAAFKPDSDDIRDSPALAVADAISDLGGHITVCDPQATDNARRRHPSFSFTEDPLVAAKDAHVILHLTEWAMFQDVDPGLAAQYAHRLCILDARNTLDAARWRLAGWQCASLGRQSSKPAPALT
ncbi:MULTISPECIES: UDP-glucose dehydrogenase family protein [unclassified Streptomyces]|uniref:UDP-glucose dehydrogenase family protein n=1 Tax=unclassified Streptomyces TaxID=2593676 RepID=UPI00380333CF